MARPKKSDVGREVVFIYNPGHHHDPCHAVIKDVNGPWSRNRIGFCGCEPASGPMPWCTQPDGGLCRVCAHYVEQKGGKYVVRDVKPHPSYYRHVRTSSDVDPRDED